MRETLEAGNDFHIHCDDVTAELSCLFSTGRRENPAAVSIITTKRGPERIEDAPNISNEITLFLSDAPTALREFARALEAVADQIDRQRQDDAPWTDAQKVAFGVQSDTDTANRLEVPAEPAESPSVAVSNVPAE